MRAAQKNQAPAVVLLTPDRDGSLRRTVGQRRNQTVINELELVIVAPSLDRLRLDNDELKGFCAIRVVEFDPPGSFRFEFSGGLPDKLGRR
jgi:hypothetical protein